MAENNVSTEANVDVNATPEVAETETKAEDNTPKVEDLMSELAQLKADMAKNKNALDKALREKGEITKKLREKQTAEEAEAKFWKGLRTPCEDAFNDVWDIDNIESAEGD